jgi:hypothetical protein
MALITGRLGNYQRTDIVNLREALRDLVVETLENAIKFSVKKENNNIILPGKSYLGLMGLLRSKRIEKSTSIITFNYDICVDLALQVEGLTFNYCLNGESNEFIDLLKLHGSINWTTAADDERIVAYEVKDMVEGYKESAQQQSESQIVLPFSESFRNKSKLYGIEISKSHVIVPPTWNKTHYHGSLANVWRVAAQSLAAARDIFVFGYSLPETDSFFRYLFATGTISESRIRRFFVFDPDQRAEERYARLLGPSLHGRFKFYKLAFKEAVKHLANHFNP